LQYLSRCPEPRGRKRRRPKRYRSGSAQSTGGRDTPGRGRERSPRAIGPGNVTVNFRGADIKDGACLHLRSCGRRYRPVARSQRGRRPEAHQQAVEDGARHNRCEITDSLMSARGTSIRVVTVNQLKQEELASQTFSLNYSKAKRYRRLPQAYRQRKRKVTYDERRIR